MLAKLKCIVARKAGALAPMPWLGCCYWKLPNRTPNLLAFGNWVLPITMPLMVVLLLAAHLANSAALASVSINKATTALLIIATCSAMILKHDRSALRVLI